MMESPKIGPIKRKWFPSNDVFMMTIGGTGASIHLRLTGRSREASRPRDSSLDFSNNSEI